MVNTPGCQHLLLMAAVPHQNKPVLGLTLTMRARAVSVNFRAHTRSLGTSNRRASSVTVATMTAILSSCRAHRRQHRLRYDQNAFSIALANIQQDVWRLQAHLATHEPAQLGQGQRGPVCLGHKQTLQHNLIEVAVCAPDQEAVELQGKRQQRVSSKVMMAVAVAAACNPPSPAASGTHCRSWERSWPSSCCGHPL